MNIHTLLIAVSIFVVGCCTNLVRNAPLRPRTATDPRRTVALSRLLCRIFTERPLPIPDISANGACVFFLGGMYEFDGTIGFPGEGPNGDGREDMGSETGNEEKNRRQ